MSKQIIDIGIAESSRVEIADGLSRLLADTYTLYIKTHYYHWNVTGPMFNSLHLMFENQYNELATAVDDIAERIRSLGCFAPGTYHEFSRLTAVNEDKDIPAAKNMIENLVQGQETVVKEVAIKWSAAPDMTPQTVLYRRPVAQFSNFQPKIVSSWLILALFQANFLISGRSRLCPYQLVNSNQVRQGE